MPKELVLNFPDELKDEDLKDSDVRARAMEAAVLELLKKGRVSQGKAAEILRLSRQDLFDLMSKYDIPMANFPPEELQRQVAEVERRDQSK